MLIHVKREEALALVKQVMQAIPRKTTVKALEGIHMEADANRSLLTLTATNLEIAIRASLCAAAEQSGSVILPARFLADALSRFDGDTVGLELDEAGRCTLRSGRARYEIQALPGAKYPMPELPFPEDTISVKGLRSLARKLLFAAAEDNAALMSCVKLTLGPEGLKAVSTNGFCVAEARGDDSCKGQAELLIPARSLSVLASISHDSDVYEMGLAGKSVVFWDGTLLFTARLREGRYPDTALLMERFNPRYSVSVSAEELAAALDAAAVLKAESPRVALAIGAHELRACLKSPGTPSEPAFFRPAASKMLGIHPVFLRFFPCWTKKFRPIQRTRRF